MDILVIAVCAVISGAEGWEDIEEYGQANAEWLGDQGHLVFGHEVAHQEENE
jgi:DDE_Tnp_1-associated